ncbi:AraC family transcriptional regulator [uncultured Roseibium sp.]|uniref:helix-turn-helix domain-containing protein n=1 Tax=uncultured Roseibium sp. TaxID=1936171 RepID=UPI0026091C6B|nr:AraC family transcriptional regulator [uncultured Roseibium sp.]
MLFVPLPFVNAILLALVFVLLRRSDTHSTTRAFLMLIALCCLQSIVLGLRWGYQLDALRFVQPVLAAMLPPLTYESFRGLRDRMKPDAMRLAAVPLAAFSAVCLLLLAPQFIDSFLLVLVLAYALALAILARSGPDSLELARLDSASLANRAIWWAAACLLASAGFDWLILLDFERSGGSNAAMLVSNANILSLLIIGLAALAAGKTQVLSTGDVEKLPPAPTSADTDIVSRVDTLMSEKNLYRDENLNLSRLARAAGLPPRQVSQAINKVRDKNVSRYVNDFRIDEACRLLRQDNVTVTEAMFRSGFSTKSNFNREFLRTTGTTPDAWRKSEGT